MIFSAVLVKVILRQGHLAQSAIAVCAVDSCQRFILVEYVDIQVAEGPWYLEAILSSKVGTAGKEEVGESKTRSVARLAGETSYRFVSHVDNQQVQTGNCPRGRVHSKQCAVHTIHAVFMECARQGEHAHAQQVHGWQAINYSSTAYDALRK